MIPTTLVQDYIDHGLKLTPIPPGSKAPRNPGWNQPGAELKSAADLPDGYGVGLLHAASFTCALDLDDLEQAIPMLKEHGIDLPALLDAPDAVQIVSGKHNRAKLLYSVPAFMGALQSKKISVKNDGVNVTVYELRSGTANGSSVQCCIEPTVHPETLQSYKWGGKGHWSRLPTIPSDLLSLWQSLISKDSERVIKVDGANPASWHEVEAALNTISPDCSRDEWRNVGMALNVLGHQSDHDDHAFELWNSWSKRSETKYPGEGEILEQWRSFKPDGGISIGTLFHIAQEYGWVRPEPDVTGMFAPVADQPPRFQLLTPADLARMPPVKWLVRGVLPAEGIGAVFGPSGAGKSFLVLDLLASVAIHVD